MSHRSGVGEGHLTSEGYLEYIDERLGFPRGTLHGICLAAVKSKTESKRRAQGDISRRDGTPDIDDQFSSIRSVRKAVFLIEFKMTKAGKQMDRVVQVHLEV